jgi:hypothetical protein
MSYNAQGRNINTMKTVTQKRADTITLSITEYEQLKKDAERWKKVKYYGYFRLGNAFTTKTLFNEKAEEYIDSLSIDQAIAKDSHENN